MSHYLGLIHFSLPADFNPSQIVNNVRAKLDYEMEALAKRRICSPDYYRLTGLVCLDRVGDSYAAYVHHPEAADSYDTFSRLGHWLGLPDLSVAIGEKRHADAETLCKAALNAILPDPPPDEDETLDSVITSLGANEWRAAELCDYIMESVNAQVQCRRDYKSFAERLIRSETWAPSTAPRLDRPFIYAADAADLIGRPHGLTRVDRQSHPTLGGRSILPPSAASGHWLTFVDLHA